MPAPRSYPVRRGPIGGNGMRAQTPTYSPMMWRPGKRWTYEGLGGLGIAASPATPVEYIAFSGGGGALGIILSRLLGLGSWAELVVSTATGAGGLWLYGKWKERRDAAALAAATQLPAASSPSVSVVDAPVTAMVPASYRSTRPMPGQFGGIF